MATESTKPTFEMVRSDEERIGDITTLLRFFTREHKIISKDHNYSSCYNSWLNQFGYVSFTYAKAASFTPANIQFWVVERRLGWKGPDGNLKALFVRDTNGLLKDADNNSALNMMIKVLNLIPQSQIEDEKPLKESVQGDSTQSSSKSSTTIITRDQQEIVQNDNLDNNRALANISSTEPMYTMEAVVGRNMPLQAVEFSTSQKQGDCIEIWRFPDSSYEINKCAPNVLPFETFIYSDFDLELNFIVNANKFQCGKVIIAPLYDSYQSEVLANDWKMALQRQHLILDLSTNTQGVLKIPFRFHRTFVRNFRHSKSNIGVNAAQSVTVYCFVLSPLSVGEGGMQKANIRGTYRYTRADFAGMSYRVPLTQMEGVGEIAVGLLHRGLGAGLKDILVNAEKCFDQVGRSRDQDKPTDVMNIIQTVPRCKLNFCMGSGLADVVAMKMNPGSLTTFMKNHKDEAVPNLTTDIAQIWGLRGSFRWAATDGEAKELYSDYTDPTYRIDFTHDAKVKNKDLGINFTPSPLEYVSSMYSFWGGTIEYRFDFVSNAFHTGSVLISVEFNRPSSADTATACEAYSTYTKVFHLGDQKSVSFRVPYIYDTPYRRNNQGNYNMYWNARDKMMYDGDDKLDFIGGRKQAGIRSVIRTKISVRVINPLKPVQSIAQGIEVLVFHRGSKSFRVMGLCQAGLTSNLDTGKFDHFPLDYDPTKVEKELNILPQDIKTKSFPIVQMETGEKENEDGTDNFNVGDVFNHIQNTDDQVKILSILKRPVYLFTDKITKYKVDNDANVECFDNGFWIPVQPPSRMMFQLKPTVVGDTNIKINLNRAFNPMLQTTPQVALLNMFRFWRGSIRYTFMFHNAGTDIGNKILAPIYITHVPHNGSRVFGNYTTLKNDDRAVKKYVHKWATIPPFCSGNTTEVVVPWINPCVTIEVPYATENNWTLMFDEKADRNFSWRDKGDTNSGHLILSSVQSYAFDCWISAGDDFEISNFYGVPPCLMSGQFQILDDDRPKKEKSNDVPHSQMEPSDFPMSNLRTNVRQVMNSMKSIPPTAMAMGVVHQVPILGPMITTSYGVGKVEGAINSCESKLNHVVDNVNGVSALLSSVLGKVDNILDYIPNVHSMGQILWDFLLDLINIINHKTWTSLGVCFLRVFSKCVNITSIDYTKFTEVTNGLGDWFSRMIRMVNPERPVAQNMWEDCDKTLLALFISLIGIMTNTYLSEHEFSFKSLVLSFIRKMTSMQGLGYVNYMLNIFKNFFDLVVMGVYKVLGYKDPRAHALQMLSGQNENLKKFVQESQLMLSEANSSMMNTPLYRRRYWLNVVQAYQLQRLMLDLPNNSVSPILSKLCNDVISVANKNFLDISASPVRFEPMVVCIEGAPGIGKSFASTKIAETIIKGMNIKSLASDLVYTVQPGSKYWSGYRDQPVVIYDDWLNVLNPEMISVTLAELYKLKSTSVFIPEMAELTEKKIRANPLVVILVCNSAFPNNIVNNAVQFPDAVYRRRDLVFRLEKNCEGLVSQLPLQRVKDFSHLSVRKYSQVTEESSLGSSVLDFSTFLNYLKSFSLRYYKREQINVNTRLQYLKNNLEGFHTSNIDIADPFQLFYSITDSLENNPEIFQNAYLPSEILEAQVTQIVTAVDGQPIAAYLDEYGAQAFVPDPFVTAQDDEELSTRSVWSKLLYVMGLEGEIQACSICMAEKPAFVTCGVSSQHYICESCHHTDMSIRSNIFSCPQCRDPRFRYVVDGTVVKLLSILKRYWHRAAAFLLDIYSWLHPRRHTIALLVGLVVGTISPEQLFCQGVLLSTIGLTALSGSVLLQAMSQADDEFGDANDENQVGAEWDLPQDPVEIGPRNQHFRLTIREDVLDRCLLTTNTREVCCHQPLLDYMHRPTEILYSEGFWLVPVENLSVMAPIPENFCSINCLLHRDIYESFIRCFVEARENAYRAQILNLMGRGPNVPLQEYLKAIPKYCWPDWLIATNPNLQEQIDRMTDLNWWDKLTTYPFSSLCQILKYVTVGLATLYSFYRLYNYMFSGAFPLEQSSDQLSGNVMRHVIQRSVHPRTRQVFSQDEGQTPVGASLNLVFRNTLMLEIFNSKNERVRVLKSVGLFGHYVILPRHYVRFLRDLKDGCYIMATLLRQYPFGGCKLNLCVDDIIESKKTDCAIIKVPKSIGIFRDIRKMIALDTDIVKGMSDMGTLLLAPNSKRSEVISQPISIFGYQHHETVEQKDGSLETYYSLLTYDYSEDGACGDFVFRETSQRPIVAMHVAGIGVGENGKGYGVLLTQELIAELLLNEDKEIPIGQAENDFLSIEQARILFDEEVRVNYLGTVSQELVCHVPGSSKIKSSLLQGVIDFPIRTGPAVMSKNDPRYQGILSPLIAGSRKHGLLTNDFTSQEVREVSKFLKIKFYDNMVPNLDDCKILTLNEALVGFPGIEFYDPVDLKTSAGWPWCSRKFGNKAQKSNWITYDTNEQDEPIGVNYVDPSILDVIHKKDILRNKGEVPYTVFVDMLKDERKALEKIPQEGKTRVFCMSPVDYTIQVRQYFLHFCASFMKNRLNLQHCVGISADGKEWGELYRQLVKVSSQNIVSMDYSNFGPGFNAVVAWEASEIIVDWTMNNVKGCNRQFLRILMFELINSVHLCNNLVYQQFGGAPSGSALTVILNSIVNEIYIGLAWRSIYKNIPPTIRSDSKWEDYTKFLTLKVYGDDCIIAVSSDVIKYFNGITIANYFKEYNIVVSDATKTEEIVDKKSINSAIFLKRGFRPHPYLPFDKLAPLDRNSVEEACLWIWDDTNKKDATRVNAEASLRLSYGHGKVFFEEHKNKLNKGLRSIKCDPILLDWEDLDKLFFSDETIISKFKWEKKF